ncbi:TadE family protein [Janibacter sp. DB-40]|uniref:TadE/TadG family type IV pilus assembly protein n=1 Tax=Janibacter sp. DB-40 TaxID=3028808 RepID=UPI0024054CD3|nr:TadE family protein [Janibacter sp. DB-40]
MRSIRRPGRGGHDRGAAAVEMALVLPLLLVIVGGVADFGRYFFYEVTLTNAVREGARVAVVDDTADVELRVRTATNDLPGLTVVPGSCSGAGTDVEVTATYPDFQWFLLDPAMGMFGSEMTLLPEAKAVMRCEV